MMPVNAVSIQGAGPTSTRNVGPRASATLPTTTTTATPLPPPATVKRRDNERDAVREDESPIKKRKRGPAAAGSAPPPPPPPDQFSRRGRAHGRSPRRTGNLLESFHLN